jgi:acyl carrier protein
VSVASTWDDFGLDPLDRVEVLLAVEEEFGVIIPDDTSNAIENITQTVEKNRNLGKSARREER